MILTRRRILNVCTPVGPVVLLGAAMHVASGLPLSWTVLIYAGVWIYSAFADRLRLPAGPLPTDDRLRQAIASLPANLPGPVECAVVPGGDSIPQAAALVWTRPPRILVNPTMLETMDDRQLRAVLAHEVAHVERDDPHWPLVLAAFGSLLTGAAVLWAVGAVSPVLGADRYFLAGAALAVVVLEALAGWSLLAADARRQERWATRRAVELSGDPDAYLAAARRILEAGAPPADKPRRRRRTTVSGLPLADIEAIVRQASPQAPR